MNNNDKPVPCVEFEQDFLTLVVTLFTNSNIENFVPFSLEQMDEEQRLAVSRCISELYTRRINTDNVWDSVGFFTFMMLKCAAYYHLLTPDNEVTLQRALTDSLFFSEKKLDIDGKETT